MFANIIITLPSTHFQYRVTDAVDFYHVLTVKTFFPHVPMIGTPQ